MENKQVREKFTEDEFTEDELVVLKLAFKLAEEALETLRTSNSDVYMINELFYLKEKLGIDDLLE